MNALIALLATRRLISPPGPPRRRSRGTYDQGRRRRRFWLRSPSDEADRKVAAAGSSPARPLAWTAHRHCSRRRSGRRRGPAVQVLVHLVQQQVGQQRRQLLPPVKIRTFLAAQMAGFRRAFGLNKGPFTAPRSIWIEFQNGRSSSISRDRERQTDAGGGSFAADRFDRWTRSVHAGRRRVRRRRGLLGGPVGRDRERDGVTGSPDDHAGAVPGRGFRGAAASAPLFLGFGHHFPPRRCLARCSVRSRASLTR